METHEIIKDYRKRKNLTQKQLADLLDVSDKAVSKWENGEGLPDIENLKRLSAVFNVSIDVLLGNQHINTEKREINVLGAILSGVLLLLYFLPFYGIKLDAIFDGIFDFDDVFDGFSQHEVLTVNNKGFHMMFESFNSFGFGNILMTLSLGSMFVFGVYKLYTSLSGVKPKVDNKFKTVGVIGAGIFGFTYVVFMIIGIGQLTMKLTPFVAVVLVFVLYRMD